ncbi:MAG: flagellar hook-basal body complex protein FliE [Oscillospiraceae bacterium]|jgi:flagellar hook-basal body complex protein FliE|nr:flagellar hook-basal body complex protein FliE [Oscillospiraceae bacterium]
MQINPLSANLVNLLNHEPLSMPSGRTTGEDGSFSSILSEAFNTVEKTDAIDKGSTLQLLMGEADDLSGMMIDIQKAELSLQLALQIRNKIIDAYNEVMRMSV